MDPVTLRAVAEMARQRGALAKSAVLRERLQDKRDGLERLGAARALDQLARDLEATADEFEANPDPADEWVRRLRLSFV